MRLRPRIEHITETMSEEQFTDHEIQVLLRSRATFDEGFRLLVSTYQERLYWHIRRMVLDHEDASDLLQDILVKVYRGLPGFRGDSGLFTWLYIIATNEVRSFLRKKKKMPLVGEEGLVSQQLVADKYFDGDELQLRLQEALAGLPEKQRLVFQMRYYEELSYREMSAILQTSEGALKASFHHAVKKIEQYIRQTAN